MRKSRVVAVTLVAALAVSVGCAPRAPVGGAAFEETRDATGRARVPAGGHVGFSSGGAGHTSGTLSPGSGVTRGGFGGTAHGASSGS